MLVCKVNSGFQLCMYSPVYSSGMCVCMYICMYVYMYVNIEAAKIIEIPIFCKL